MALHASVTEDDSWELISIGKTFYIAVNFRVLGMNKIGHKIFLKINMGIKNEADAQQKRGIVKFSQKAYVWKAFLESGFY